jgi:hypothetical protein
MNKYILVILGLLSISLSAIGSTTKYDAKETFNNKTGELFWDINQEVRLVFNTGCYPYNFNRGESSDSFQFFKRVDIFSVFDHYESEHYVDCKKRGLKVIYRLREDGIFEGYLSYDIDINGYSLWYPYPSFENNRSSEINNYLYIYSALEEKKEIIVTLKFKDSEFRNLEDYEIKSIVSPQDIENSVLIHKQILQHKAAALNQEIKEKYKYIIIFDALGLIALLVMFRLYRSKLHDKLKNIIKLAYKKVIAVPNLIKSIKMPSSGVIKSNKLKPYSVADELLKWAELRDKGHVTEQEYDNARKELLSRGAG